jgi:hypothetical protein
MIYDRLGDINNASINYKRAIDKCLDDKSGINQKSTHYMKAMTNYAITLEKLN